jgi:hypothetical protein
MKTKEGREAVREEWGGGWIEKERRRNKGRKEGEERKKEYF